MRLPLIIDLDGTLIKTDMLYESVVGSLHHSIAPLFSLPLWLSRGKASLKQSLAPFYDFDPATLPYHQDLLAWLHQQKQQGCSLILCTASDQSFAQKIADYVGIFDDVISSDGITNLSGKLKAEALVKRFGDKGFDYAGNSPKDLAVWRHANRAIVIDDGNNLVGRASELCQIDKVFTSKSAGMNSWFKAMRVHQWLKNLLLFVPLLAAHQLSEISAWQSLIISFLSFSLCASAVYIANDLMDLQSDRKHPRKQKRPFASGDLSVISGLLITPLLLILSFFLAMQVTLSFCYLLLSYFFITCMYTLKLKRVILIDCITLALLYTLRIVAGALAVTMPLSFWLLAFSVFIFLSLAFVKRYAELEIQTRNHKEKIHGRGYYTTDGTLIQTLGITAGYSAILVLALYLNSDAVTKLYHSPEVIWGVVPVMLFWISWMWMQAHRGNMHDDPLVFAIKDQFSLISGLIVAVVLIVGAIGLPW